MAKEKKDWSIGILAAIVIPLLGVAVTLFAVFYEKPKTFLPNPLLDQAEVLLIEGDNDGAIAKAEQAKIVEPDNPRIYLVIYAAHELSDRHDEAVQALRNGTEQVKKRATGGKAIRAVLVAAEASPEDGLTVVAESYRGFGPEFEKLAKRLRELFVDFFRPVVATTTEVSTTTESPTTTEAMTTTTEPTTTKKINGIAELSNFFSTSGIGFSGTASELAQQLGLVGTYNTERIGWESKFIYDGENICVIPGDNDEIEEIFNSHRGPIEFTLFGIKAGYERNSTANAITSHGFASVREYGNNRVWYWNESNYILLNVEFAEGVFEAVNI